MVHKLHCPINNSYYNVNNDDPSLTFINTCPLSLSISPNSADIKDDLPAPTGPTTATNSPPLTNKSMLQLL